MSVLDTSLSVGSLRPTLQRYTDPMAAKAGAFNPTAAPNFIPRLMEVCDQLNDEGLWKGVTGEVWYNGSTTGYITLPRRYYSIEGAVCGSSPVNMFSTFNQFKDMGLGWRKASKYNQIGFTDDGDGHCTQLDLKDGQPSVLTINCNINDIGKTIRFSGEDNNDDTIYDESGDSATGSEGITIMMTSVQIVTSQIFKSIERIIVPTNFLYPWTLSAVIDGALTQIGRYEPGEQSPSYRRYKTGNISPASNQNTMNSTIVVYCKRRIIPLIYETDLVFPGAARALGLGLQALNYENIDGAPKKAEEYWGLAIDNLNKKIKSARGKQNNTIAIRYGYDWCPTRVR